MLVTKKNVLLAGLIATTLFILMGVGNAQFGLSCSVRINERIDPHGGPLDSNGEYLPALVWDKIEWCEPVAMVLIPFILLVPFSFLTYKLREEVFQAWFRFAGVWIPLWIIVTLPLTLGGSGGGFGMNLAHPEAVIVFFAGTFSVISLIIIAWKYAATRKG